MKIRRITDGAVSFFAALTFPMLVAYAVFWIVIETLEIFGLPKFFRMIAGLVILAVTLKIFILTLHIMESILPVTGWHLPYLATGVVLYSIWDLLIFAGAEMICWLFDSRDSQKNRFQF
ncbi:hypothetical protein D4R51_00525 [bacterium]|nr:MAG: hypothetical protein D4R51_00525 [bacterium]